MEEVWKNLGFLGFSNYEVSNTGKVRTIKTKFEHKFEESHGYYRIQLSQNDGKIKKFLVHRLVALCFIPNTEDKPQVDHIDGNKHNNNVNNLRWSTASENQLNPSTHYKTCGENHYTYGESRSEETRKKISDTLTGRSLSDEHRNNISIGCKGKNKGKPSYRKGLHWRTVNGHRVWY